MREDSYDLWSCLTSASSAYPCWNEVSEDAEETTQDSREAAQQLVYRQQKGVMKQVLSEVEHHSRVSWRRLA